MRYPPSVLEEIRARLPVSSIVGRRVTVPASALQNSAWQMLAAAVAFTVTTVALHEPLVAPSAVPWWAWAAIAYLVFLARHPELPVQG